MRILLHIFSILIVSISAVALPQFFNSLSSQFPKGTLVHKCMTCHVGKASPALNSFGKDYRGVFIAADPLKIPGINVMTFNQKWDYFLNKVDSNKNGVSNFQDIMNGLNPGIAQ